MIRIGNSHPADGAGHLHDKNMPMDLQLYPV